MLIPRSHKKLGAHFAAGGAGFFMALALLGPAEAQSLAGAAIPATTNAAPSAPIMPNESADAKPATSISPPKSADKSNNPPVAGLSIDDLLNVTVTSAGQKEQKLSDVAAALTVLNADDIRRSGATTIPDLLRYVPGVDVGQSNNSDVSVTIRGFGGVFATKLLVLIDGRSIYDPIFGGVDWQYERMMMEDIERVEIIRGPGATVWGANAVNGVINIITKDAADTQGGLVSSTYGSKEDGMGTFRYGFSPTQGLSIRLYGQYENVATSDPLPGDPRYDQLQNGVLGFRADYRPDTDDHFRLSSDGSQTRAGDELFTLAPATSYTQDGNEENVNFVYEHNFDTDNQVTVQSYYDRFRRNTDPAEEFSDQLVQTYDVQIRHTLPLHLLPIKQELTYGAEYREVGSQLTNTRIITWLRGRNDQTASMFVQTDLHLIDNVLTLTMGAKYDHNDYTGNEVQPSARLLWKIDSKNSLWGSVSRAVREPQVLDFEATQPGTLSGNSNLKSEVLIAYEIGYRVQPTDWLSFDLATYYNNYTNLIQAYFPPGSFIPTEEQFKKAEVYGIEPSFTAQVQPWWKLSGSYSLLNFHADNGGIPAGYGDLDPSLDSVDPTNEFSLRSSFDLPNNIDLDIGGRYVDKTVGADAYFAADVRLAWRPTPAWEVSIVGQNLLAGNHLESPNQFGNTTYVSPEVYGKIAFKF
jgi:iron complex outermembrane receptor protein